MAVKIIWNSHEWAEALRGLPIEGPLPNRTVLVPSAAYCACPAARADPKRAATRACGNTFRFASDCRDGSAARRRCRVSAGRRSSSRDPASLHFFARISTLRHFPIDLLRSTPGWEAAFAQTISDLEGAGLRPDDVVAESAQLEDVITIWRSA